MDTWKENKLVFLDVCYGRQAKTWKRENPNDDRQLYINTYDMMVEAVKSLPDDPLCYVRVAMNDSIHKDCEILKNISERYYSDPLF